MNKNMLKKLLILLIPVSLVAATVGTVIYANKVVGIYSQENFMDNGDFEKNTYGTVLSGGGSTAISIGPAFGIFGNALQVDTPQANDEIRIGISNRIVALGGLNCEARFNLKLGSTNTVPTVVDVDVLSNAGTLSISNTQRVTLSTSNSWIPMSVNFPCSRPVGATYARIKIITAGTASVGNPYFWVDSVYAGEATNITNQASVTDWQDFPSVAVGTLITQTTTNPAYGSVLYNKAQYRYVGTDVEIKWDFAQNSAGTVGNGDIDFNIPTSICVIDVNKAKDLVTTLNGIGVFANYARTRVGDLSVSTSSNHFEGFLSVKNQNTLRGFFVYTNGTTTSRASWSSSYGGFGDNPLTIVLNAKLPCVGRSATQSAITQQCIQDGSCENEFSAQINADGTIVRSDNGFIPSSAVWNSGVGTYTITFKSGFFSAAPYCFVSGDDSYSATQVWRIRPDVTTASTTVVHSTQNTGVGSTGRFFLTCRRGPTDYKPRFAAPALVGSVTSNAAGALRIEGVKLSSTGVVTYETSDWISGNCSGSSPYACTINAGVFSATPVCVATSGVGAAFTAETFTVLTATAFTIQKIGNNAGATEVICFGLR